MSAEALRVSEAFSTLEGEPLQEKREDEPQRGPVHYSRQGIVCYWCGKMGHMSHECIIGALEKWRPTREAMGLKERQEAHEQVEEMDCSFGHC